MVGWETPRLLSLFGYYPTCHVGRSSVTPSQTGFTLLTLRTLIDTPFCSSPGAMCELDKSCHVLMVLLTLFIFLRRLFFEHPFFVFSTYVVSLP